MKAIVIFLATLTVVLCLGCPSVENIEPDDFSRYLNNGELTTLTEDNKKLLGLDKVNYSGMKALVWGYMLSKSVIYKETPTGGEFIGKRSVNDIILDKSSTGTHDDAIILASIYRELGIPTVMIETVNLDWAVKYKNEEVSWYHIHVLLEVFIDGNWMLVDPINGNYSPNYDVSDSNMKLGDNGEHFYLHKLFKGLDPLDYAIRSNEELQKSLGEYAQSINSTEITSEISVMYSIRDYYEYLENDFNKVFQNEVTVNYSYLGEFDVSEEEFININIDRFIFGYPINNNQSYTKKDSISFNVISDFPFVYVIGFVDLDRSGWSSIGDVEFQYSDSHGVKMPISLLEENIINIEFDDSLRNY